MKHTPRILATALLVLGPIAVIGTGHFWPIMAFVAVCGGLLTMLAEYCEDSYGI